MDYLQALARWEQLKATLAAVKDEEAALRKALFDATFPNPTEGVNTFALPDGRTIKGTYKITRKVLEEKFKGVLKKMGFTEKHAPVKVAHTLVKASYDLLSEENRKAFDECLEIKPGAPTFEIVVPEQEPASE